MSMQMRLGQQVQMNELAALVLERVRGGAARERLLVALAGPPGAGKSTCADHLNSLSNDSNECRSAVLQMDGFHYDDAILIPRGLRSRKGSPDTFDVSGLHHTLDRLRQNVESEIAVPVFDRSLELSRAGARMISRSINVLIVEGNYILLDQAPWSALRPLFDVTVSIAVPEQILRQRLYARWEAFGIPAAEIPEKVEANDLPNGVLVLAKSLPSEFILHN